MLKKLVDDYMENQWINCRRALTFYEAREEILWGAKLYFFVSGSTTPKYVFENPEYTNPYPTPVIANANGVFPEMHLDGHYSLHIENRDGDILIMQTTRDGFDLYG